jgi:predicted DCC family thiol-disulfide oxidoreductase YuxK
MQQFSKVIVLYDGSCRLCRRSVSMLRALDWLHRLLLIDFRSTTLRIQYAPDITEESLHRALHIRLPDGRTFAGFDAFRELSKHLPMLWVTVPFLYFPFVAPIGRGVYGFIARRRERCGEGKCIHE